MEKNIFLDYGYSSNSEEKLKLIKQNGFDGVFLFADDSFDDNFKLCSKYNLKVETIHLPFKGVCNLLWLDNNEAKQYIEDTKNWIKKASSCGIDKVVFHLSQSLTPPAICELGFTRVKELLKVCEEYNVYLALENLRYPKYLDAVLENVTSDKLICCFDSGHANCFTKNIEIYDFEKYQGLIKCLHLHDNHGEKDEHLLPFMGNINFEEVLRKLKNTGFNGPLTLEVIVKKEVLPEEEFIRKAKETLDKLEEYFNE